MSEGEIAKSEYTPPIQVGVTLGVGVMCPREKALGTYSWRLTTYGESYIASDGEGLLQAQSVPLRMIVMIATGPGQGLPLVSLSCVMRIAIIGRGAKIHLTGA